MSVGVPDRGIHSESEWLGQLPSRWTRQPLKSLFKIVGGSTPRSDIEAYWEGTIVWVTPTDLADDRIAHLAFSQRMITKEGLASCGTTLVPPRSIVLSTRAPIGSLGIAEVPLCTNQGCKSLVPRQNAESTFYAYLLSIATEQLRVRGKGTTFLELSSDELGAVSVPVPPLSEQVAIAAFLDRETSKIDALVKEQKRLIELLKEKRQAVISHAVTKGLNPHVSMKASGVEWLGEVPEHWEMKRLGQLAAELQTGPFGSQLHSVDYIQGGTPVINPSNLQGGQIFPDWSNTAGEELANVLGRHRLKIADIVIGRRGEMGRCALVTENAQGWLCGTGCLRVTLREPALAAFVCTYLGTSAVASYLQLVSVGSTLDNLNTSILGKTPVPCPPKGEAMQIVANLGGILQGVDDLSDGAERGVSLLHERRAALISAAVTGKIDVRGLTEAETVAA